MTAKSIFLYFENERPLPIDFDLPVIPRQGEGFIFPDKNPCIVREVSHDILKTDRGVTQVIHIHLDPDL